MGYTDAQLTLSDAQAITGTSAVASTNHVNMGTITSFVGTGEPVALVVTVDVAAGGTAPTLTIIIQSDDNTSFSSAATVATSTTYAAAALTAGAQLVLGVPAGIATEQHLRASYTQGGTAPTITVTASFKPVSMIPVQHYFPNAYNV